MKLKAYKNIKQGDILKLSIDLPLFNLKKGDVGIVLFYYPSSPKGKTNGGNVHIFFPFGTKENSKFLIGNGYAENGVIFSSSIFFLNVKHFDLNEGLT